MVSTNQKAKKGIDMSDETKPCSTGNDLEDFPDDLTLQWRYAHASGYKVMGNKGEHFSIDMPDGTAYFIGTPENPVQTSYLIDSLHETIMEEIQSLNGDLLSNDGKSVTCKIGSTTAVGPDFIRAAMLGFVKFKGK